MDFPEHKNNYGTNSSYGYQYADSSFRSGMDRIPVGKDYTNLIMKQVNIDVQVNSGNDKNLHVNKHDGENEKYIVRLISFGCTFGMLFLLYVFSFLNGWQTGRDINDLTDSIIITTISAFFGDDSKASALSSVLTLGPLSYIIVCGVISFIISLLVSRHHSNKIKYRLSDGTRNFTTGTQQQADCTHGDVSLLQRFVRMFSNLKRSIAGTDDMNGLPDIAEFDEKDANAADW